MLVRNIIYSFTQSFIESFPILFRGCQMRKFRVVPANFLSFLQIISLRRRSLSRHATLVWGSVA